MLSRIHKADERTPPRFSSNSQPLSLSLFSLVEKETAKARLSDREIVLNATFWLPFCPPSFYSSVPPLHHSYRPSTNGIKTPFYYSSSILSLSLPVLRCSVIPQNIYSSDREPRPKSNGYDIREGLKESRENESRCREELQVPPRNSTKHRKQCQRIQTVGAIKMAVQTTVQQPNPISPSCVCMQHAFGFMGASGRKSDLLKTKKKKRKRIEEKNETRGNTLEEKLFAWPTSGKGQGDEGGDRHTVAAASRRQKFRFLFSFVPESLRNFSSACTRGHKI